MTGRPEFGDMWDPYLKQHTMFHVEVSYECRGKCEKNCLLSYAVSKNEPSREIGSE